MVYSFALTIPLYCRECFNLPENDLDSKLFLLAPSLFGFLDLDWPIKSMLAAAIT